MRKWTKDQEKAIFEPSGKGNILVSAAAGSGKTAVLVERVVSMLLRKENPVSIENLLVVTFTEAAAAEMKERIVERIKRAMRNAVESGDAQTLKRLKEQIRLTSTADINTIDAFCLRVVRNNFHVLDVDPNFGIMDSGESDILIDDAMEELFDDLYTSEDAAERERFENLLRIYASNRDDEGLMKLIRKVYEFTQSFAEPLAWLEEKAGMYMDDMTESAMMKEIILPQICDFTVRMTRGGFLELRKEMLEISGSHAYWGSLLEKVNNCCMAAERLSRAEEWEDYVSFYEECIKNEAYLGSGRNKYTKKTQADEETWHEYFRRCHELRTFFRENCKQLPKLDRKEFNEYVHAPELVKIINDIAWLTERFSEKYEEKKNKRNVKTFADIEHLAYTLFRYNENIRTEYAERYEEILIDEYQDTNGLQDAIFTLISRGDENRFMVGDLKQSIYRFRGGDPMIFKDKRLRYMYDKGGKLITLSQNFRSRMQVIDSINAVFGKMMSDRVGDVDYIGTEALSRDADKDPYSGGVERYKAELCRVAVISDETEDDAEISASKAEAIQIAKRIREMKDSGYMVYAGDGKYRRLEYSDIVILMKSTKTNGSILRDTLESYLVPAFVQKEEYFERREIKLMLSLISLINNHLQDIPLVAVMRSPIGGFSDTELAMIRISGKARPFYNAVRQYKAPEVNPSEEENRLERKCARLVASLERWRGYVKQRSIASLIWTLYEETNIYDLMGALEGGEEAQANLKLLYERAKRYEESGFRGIFNFIRYIGRMEQRREDVSGAQLVNDNHNVVRIMTIHKSKGLEFPVVFLAGTTKKIMYAFPGDENRIALHNILGIGADYYNYEDLYYKKNIFCEYIRQQNRAEHLSEEMRLLYVAATRAREKLIVTASYSFGTRENYELQLSDWARKAENMPWDIAEKAKCLADWVIPVAQADDVNWIVDDVCVTKEETGAEENPEEPAAGSSAIAAPLIRQILEFDYKYPVSGAIPAKTSVTAIKEMADEENIRAEHNDTEPVYMASMPAFMRGENLGARIGTAHHQVMAYIDLDRMKTLDESEYMEFVREETARIASSGQIEKEMAEDKEITDLICENVCGFFRSGMGKQVLGARAVYREKPFEIEISACEYDRSLDEAYKDESVVVQGIIDLFFEDENGDIILVDYKTDRCRTMEEQRAVGEKYRRQLELYERAMEKILKRNVKEKYLYLFSAQNVLKLN